jgi:hypothetical protein
VSSFDPPEEMKPQLRRVLEGPDIDHRPALTDEDIDYDILNATIRVQTRKTRPKRWEVRDALIKAEVDMQLVTSLYQQRKTNEWFIEFVSQREAVDFNRQNDHLIYNGNEWSVNMHNQEVLTIKCHWMPGYTADHWYLTYFGQFGDVLDVYRSTTAYGQYKKEGDGPVMIEMKIGVQERAIIPHIVSNADGTSMLITMPGRQPLCLECNKKGHIRKDCPELAASRQAGVFQRQRMEGRGVWGTNTPTSGTIAPKNDERDEAIRLAGLVNDIQQSTLPAVPGEQSDAVPGEQSVGLAAQGGPSDIVLERQTGAPHELAMVQEPTVQQEQEQQRMQEVRDFEQKEKEQKERQLKEKDQEQQETQQKEKDVQEAEERLRYNMEKQKKQQLIEEKQRREQQKLKQQEDQQRKQQLEEQQRKQQKDKRDMEEVEKLRRETEAVAEENRKLKEHVEELELEQLQQD